MSIHPSAWPGTSVGSTSWARCAHRHLAGTPCLCSGSALRRGKDFRSCTSSARRQMLEKKQLSRHGRQVSACSEASPCSRLCRTVGKGTRAVLQSSHQPRPSPKVSQVLQIQVAPCTLSLSNRVIPCHSAL